MKLKTWWKKQEYWLKGAIIGAILQAIMFAAMIISGLFFYLVSFLGNDIPLYIDIPGRVIAGILFIVMMAVGLPAMIMTVLLSPVFGSLFNTQCDAMIGCNPTVTFLITIIILLVYVAAGALIGLMISKIKSSKKGKKVKKRR